MGELSTLVTNLCLVFIAFDVSWIASSLHTIAKHVNTQQLVKEVIKGIK